MPNVLVRDLPPGVHARLVELAAARGQSLQQLLVSELARIAAEPTMDEVIARIERRAGGRVGFDRAVADLDEERSSR